MRSTSSPLTARRLKVAVWLLLSIIKYDYNIVVVTENISVALLIGAELDDFGFNDSGFETGCHSQSRQHQMDVTRKIYGCCTEDLTFFFLILPGAQFNWSVCIRNDDGR